MISPICFGGPARLLRRSGGLDLLVLDAPHLLRPAGRPLRRPDGKDWPDNWRRFAALGLARRDIAPAAITGFGP